ncbi:MAG: hypothetical protein ABH857_01510 [Elusimicrobiota bacterium]
MRLHNTIRFISIFILIIFFININKNLSLAFNKSNQSNVLALSSALNSKIKRKIILTQIRETGKNLILDEIKGSVKISSMFSLGLSIIIGLLTGSILQILIMKFLRKSFVNPFIHLLEKNKYSKPIAFLLKNYFKAIGLICILIIILSLLSILFTNLTFLNPLAHFFGYFSIMSWISQIIGPYMPTIPSFITMLSLVSMPFDIEGLDDFLPDDIEILQSPNIQSENTVFSNNFEDNTFEDGSGGNGDDVPDEPLGLGPNELEQQDGDHWDIFYDNNHDGIIDEDDTLLRKEWRDGEGNVIKYWTADDKELFVNNDSNGSWSVYDDVNGDGTADTGALIRNEFHYNDGSLRMVWVRENGFVTTYFYDTNGSLTERVVWTGEDVYGNVYSGDIYNNEGVKIGTIKITGSSDYESSFVVIETYSDGRTVSTWYDNFWTVKHVYVVEESGGDDDSGTWNWATGDWALIGWVLAGISIFVLFIAISGGVSIFFGAVIYSIVKILKRLILHNNEQHHEQLRIHRRQEREREQQQQQQQQPRPQIGEPANNPVNDPNFKGFIADQEQIPFIISYGGGKDDPILYGIIPCIGNNVSYEVGYIEIHEISLAAAKYLSYALKFMKDRAQINKKIIINIANCKGKGKSRDIVASVINIINLFLKQNDDLEAIGTITIENDEIQIRGSLDTLYDDINLAVIANCNTSGAGKVIVSSIERLGADLIEGYFGGVEDLSLDFNEKDRSEGYDWYTYESNRSLENPAYVPGELIKSAVTTKFQLRVEEDIDESDIKQREPLKSDTDTDTDTDTDDISSSSSDGTDLFGEGFIKECLNRIISLMSKDANMSSFYTRQIKRLRQCL